MKPHFKGRTVLVTGAGGSIGSQLCRQIMSDDAAKLVLVSLTEAGLYNIERQLRKEFGKYRDTLLVPVLGSVGDTGLMREALIDVDVVIHAAAHKHVPICEANPLAAIENNVHATYQLMMVAADAGVEQFCLISSDKAVNPASIMGATKRLAELLVTDIAEQFTETKFFVVRFGNVMDSAGSVLPLWREQIAAGGPLTLTDKRCERYFMSINQAVSLVCEVVAMQPAGGTFVLEMGQPKKLIEIARELIARAKREIDIDFIGLRPGEKLTEELHYGGELMQTAVPGVSCVQEPARPPLDMDAVDLLFDRVDQRSKTKALQLLWELVR